MADNARDLGLDYEPADGTQVSKVWWDGEKLMAKPIPLEDIYQPVQEPLGYLEIDDIEGQREYPHNCRNVNLWHEGGEGMTAIYTTPPAAPVQEPVAWDKPTDEMVQAATDEYDEWAVDNKGTTECIRAMLVKALKATPPAAQPAPVQPVAFLANGTRFKINYDSRQSGGQIHGIPPELGGRWVAFVAADDNCHLKLTTPPAAQRPWVGLTDEEILEAAGIDGADTWLFETAYAIESKLKEKNT
jgi:hypothetical protein